MVFYSSFPSEFVKHARRDKSPECVTDAYLINGYDGQTKILFLYQKRSDYDL